MTLSGGQKQRLFIALALITDPKLVGVFTVCTLIVSHVFRWE